MVVIVLTEKEANLARERQINNVASTISTTLKMYPGTNPEALIACLTMAGTDFGLMKARDFSEAKSRAQNAIEKSSEPTIIVNGASLGPVEAATMRVALETFASSLSNGLGDDEHGVAMTKGYWRSVEKIRAEMYRDH